MSDAFTDVAKMKKSKKISRRMKDKSLRWRWKTVVSAKKSKQGRLIEVYPSLFIVEYSNEGGQPGEISNTYVESYTYSDILTEKNLIRYFDE